MLWIRAIHCPKLSYCCCLSDKLPLDLPFQVFVQSCDSAVTHCASAELLEPLAVLRTLWLQLVFWGNPALTGCSHALLFFLCLAEMWKDTLCTNPHVVSNC